MRTIDHIVIHCSATREDRSLTVAELEEITVAVASAVSAITTTSVRMAR